jgi:hypothetical protein
MWTDPFSLDLRRMCAIYNAQFPSVDGREMEAVDSGPEHRELQRQLGKYR